MTGFIHSFQSLGAVDGPGVRFTVFMQGCPLRCVYCHNPDTWEFSENVQTYTPEEVVAKILRYKPYISTGGGVTVTGGEPLAQWQFVSELFRLLKAEGIHTALDTSGHGDINGAEEVLKYTDLVLCDIKFCTEEAYRLNCGGSLSKTREFLSLTERMNIPLWVRHVVVPNLTDSLDNITALKNLAKSYSNLEKIELLPFRKLCLPKYDALGITFPLKDTPELSDERLAALNHFINA